MDQCCPTGGHLPGGLTFFAGKSNALNELSLCQDVDQDDGQRHHNGCCHQVSPVDSVSTSEKTQSLHQRILALIMQENLMVRGNHSRQPGK